MDRFAMAESLLARARTHAAWIGDDHGDPYEKAMLADAVDEDVQVVVKEILDHLRAALDYCARQVWQEISGAPIGSSIYFPIAREEAKPANFRSLMNRLMPGVPGLSNVALDAFTSMQAFANPANTWLPELAIMSNAAKHEHLHVAAVPEAFLHVQRDEAGTARWSFQPGHGPKRTTPWMALIERPGGTPELTTYEARYLVLSEINVELAQYLREALAGVQAIVGRCRTIV